MANTLIYQEISITRLQKGWIRMGGAINGYDMKADKREWNCQACGLEQPSQITAYLFPFMESEVLRLCPPCQNVAVEGHIDSFFELVDLVR